MEEKGNSNKTNKIEVRIQGKSYVLRGQEDVGYLQQIASFVDEKMNEITKSYPPLNTNSIAVLASLNICDLYFKLKSESDKNSADKSRIVIAESKAYELEKEVERLLTEKETMENTYLGKIQELEKEKKQLKQEFDSFLEEFSDEKSDNK